MKNYEKEIADVYKKCGLEATFLDTGNLDNKLYTKLQSSLHESEIRVSNSTRSCDKSQLQ